MAFAYLLALAGLGTGVYIAIYPDRTLVRLLQPSDSSSHLKADSVAI